MFPYYKLLCVLLSLYFFQSPFSGDFLCFDFMRYTAKTYMNTTFNLHFQEIFFVSLTNGVHKLLTKSTFQSPFSGDFLCFQKGEFYIGGIERDFQSPFSGDFLCFLRNIFVERLDKLGLSFNLHFQEIFFVSRYESSQKSQSRLLSISIFRRFSLFHGYTTNIYYCIETFNLHFQEIFFVSTAS